MNYMNNHNLVSSNYNIDNNLKTIKININYEHTLVKNNINELIATKIWDEVVDKFQGYGFNQSHSVLYSMISYQTAYLKAHYPIEFLMANLMEELKSNAPDAPTNIEKIKKEIKKYKVKFFRQTLINPIFIINL